MVGQRLDCLKGWRRDSKRRGYDVRYVGDIERVTVIGYTVR